MKIINLTYPLSLIDEEIKKASYSLAIGHFDGVHKGHQAVINKAVSVAEEKGIQSAVMTFSPHPKEVLGQGEHYHTCLTPLAKKAELFQQLGVDTVFIVQFDIAFSKVTPEEFVEQVLRPLNVVHVNVGFDFKFGARGAGNVEILSELCKPSIGVNVIEPYDLDGTKVSSTYTRECLEAGDVNMVNELLGRYFQVEGIVVHGDERGRTIGFPTANLKLLYPYAAMHLGVYAIKAYYNGKLYYGVLNHGMKPTFNKEKIVPVMEAHLFDFNQMIYDDQLTIDFVAFIRPEMKFNGIQQLIDQISQDIQQTKQLFAIH